jgi:hypothetical protein
MTHAAKSALLVAAALAALAGTGRAQLISRVDFDAIRRAVSDSGSPYHYPRLWQRLLRSDPALDLSCYRHLYYGQVYQDSYDPVNTKLLEREREYFVNVREGKRAAAAAAARELVRRDPLNLKYNQMAAAGLLQRGDSAAARAHLRRWRSLVDVILASGDGRSDTTAYVVTRVPDEYQVLRHLGREASAHVFRSTSGKRLYSDVFTLTPDGPGSDTLYFNTNWSYWYLRRSVEPDTKGNP